MSIESEIHNLWAGSAAIVAIIPESRLTTGWQPDVTLPYAYIEDDGESDQENNSGGELTGIRKMVFHLVGESYDELKTVSNEMHDVYEKAQFDYVGGRVTNIHRSNWRKERTDEGAWMLEITYDIQFTEDL